MMSRNIKMLRWFGLLHGLAPITAIAVLYFAHVTGSYTLAMAVFSIASLTTTLLEIPTGVISDHMGRKKTIIVGTAAMLLAYVLYASAHAFFALALGAIVQGLAIALYSGNNDALLYESLKEDGRVEQFGGEQGKLRSVASLAGSCASLASGFIAAASFAYLPWISAAIMALALGVSFTLEDPRIHSEKIKSNVFAHAWEAIKQFKQNARLRDLSLASTIDWGLGGSADVFRPAFVALLWPLWAVGIFRVLGDIAYGTASWFSDRIFKKIQGELVLLWGTVIKSAIRIFSYAFPTPLSPALIAGENVLIAPMHNAQDALMQAEYTEHQRATMASLNSLMGNLFFSICTIFMGYVADRIGGSRALLVSELLCLPTIVLYMKVVRRKGV